MVRPHFALPTVAELPAVPERIERQLRDVPRPGTRPARPLASCARGMALPRGFGSLLSAQFASSLADNALLIVTIALLAQRGLPVWWAPLLKFGFTVSYVVLAPFFGPLADAMPKAHLMSWMNGVKMPGVLGLLLELHPVAAFAVVGLGAAAYAPAKYSLTTELVAPERLVAANGWLEVSVVMAVLSGTVLGGVLVMPLNALMQHRGGQLVSAGRSIAVQGFNENLSILVLLAAYAALLALDVGIVVLMCDLGLLLAACMAALAWLRAGLDRTGTSGP